MPRVSSVVRAAACAVLASCAVEKDVLWVPDTPPSDGFMQPRDAMVPDAEPWPLGFYDSALPVVDADVEWRSYWLACTGAECDGGLQACRELDAAAPGALQGSTLSCTASLPKRTSQQMPTTRRPMYTGLVWMVPTAVACCVDAWPFPNLNEEPTRLCVQPCLGAETDAGAISNCPEPEPWLPAEGQPCEGSFVCAPDGWSLSEGEPQTDHFWLCGNGALHRGLITFAEL